MPLGAAPCKRVRRSTLPSTLGRVRSATRRCPQSTSCLTRSPRSSACSSVGCSMIYATPMVRMVSSSPRCSFSSPSTARTAQAPHALGFTGRLLCRACTELRSYPGCRWRGPTTEQPPGLRSGRSGSRRRSSAGRRRRCYGISRVRSTPPSASSSSADAASASGRRPEMSGSSKSSPAMYLSTRSGMSTDGRTDP